MPPVTISSSAPVNRIRSSTPARTSRGVPWMDRSVEMGGVTMAEIKGPAIATETFRVEGHCCGIRIPALMDLSSAGVQFEMSPEIRAELLEAGIRPVEGPQESPRNAEIPEPQAGQKPGPRAG